MKYYVAGKITGNPEYKAQFKAAEDKLMAEGHTIMSPAFMNQGFTQPEYLHVCMAMIDVCEGIAFLPNWPDSPGARKEMGYAIGKRKQIRHLDVTEKQAEKNFTDYLEYKKDPKEIVGVGGIYHCVARCPELDGESLCTSHLIKSDLELLELKNRPCPCGNEPKWVREGAQEEVAATLAISFLQKALDIASQEAADECCPHEFDLYECEKCATCSHDNELHLDVQRDIECWKQYYLKEARNQEEGHAR